MKSTVALGLVAGLVQAAAAADYAVVGAAEGFAYGVTGGGDATPTIPADIDELKTLLTSEDPAVIVLDKTYNFLGSEGTSTATGCAPYGTAVGCQEAIDATGNWCSSDYPSVEVTYDEAAMEGIQVASNKTIIGVDDKGIMIGKGLRFTNGASNIIVQNIMITDLNPQYVWGGDALTFADSDLIWVDHVTTQYLGRQHYVFGQDPSSRITLSNNYINGYTNYSANCDSYHYWTVELVGTDDQITFQNNYVYHTSGRSPALSGSTLFHAVNSVWEDNDGHAVEGDSNGQGLFEGCVFNNVTTPIVDDFSGHVFAATSDNADKCSTHLGRACEANSLTSSGAFTPDDDSFFSNFTGLSIASATSAEDAASSVPNNAGFGKLSSSSSSSSSTSNAAAAAAADASSSSSSSSSTTAAKASASARASSASYSYPEASATSSATPSGISRPQGGRPSGPPPQESGSSVPGYYTQTSGSTETDSKVVTDSKVSKCKRSAKLRRAQMAEDK
ncbi:putative pectin lyase C [Cytospora mali]|uniref:pectin lyase n=1 Tax=Cytospora mali TaxID=578113 RepID=A0A194USJ0_CYTMA|nr:putative pectin lyase C [Valsa mali var. pyri (nom. inval.)]